MNAKHREVIQKYLTWGKQMEYSIDGSEIKPFGNIKALYKALDYALEAIELLDDWKHELAYFTKEDVATPKGVKEFIGGFFDRLDEGKIEPVVYKLLCSMPTKFNINTVVRSFSKAIVAFVTKGETPKVNTN